MIAIISIDVITLYDITSYVNLVWGLENRKKKHSNFILIYVCNK